MLKVFLSYSHLDEDWRNLLVAHLKPLERSGLIEVWHDRQLLGGDRFDDVIDAELDDANLVLLLVSSDFINSEYCYGKELARALEREKLGELRILPVILRACRWKTLPFGKLNAAPTDGRPVSEWADRDAALDNVATFVEDIAKQGAVLPTPIPTQATSAPSPVRQATGRQLGVNVPRESTDRDRDQFRMDAFKVVRNNFEASIAALPESLGLSGIFEALDASRFRAIIYRHGKRVAGCTVFTGGEHFGRYGIAFSSDESGRTNSINEELVVKTDGKGLGLEATHSFTDANHKGLMGAEEASEYLWNKATQHLG